MQPAIKIHDRLCPAIWDDESINDDVKEHLLTIANDFIEQYDIQNVQDITITGSLANYNYTNFSDIDLHILVDSAPKTHMEKYDLAKSQWNDRHEITISGHDVEIYVQDASEPHHSSGVFSLEDERWLTKPSIYRGSLPTKEEVSKKASMFVWRLDDLMQEFSRGEEVHERAARLFKKLKNYRSAGLSDDGEYSLENLVYKRLRDTGQIKRLMELKVDSYDESLSIT